MFFKLITNGIEIPHQKRIYIPNIALVQNSFPSLEATFFDGDIYIDGQVRVENVLKWLEGPWKRVELFVSKFQNGKNIYDVPSNYIVTGIALNSNNLLVIKVLTRIAIGDETDVTDRFIRTKKRQFIPII
jgi:hypothetical protein